MKIALIPLLAVVSGCSTLVNGTTQDITFEPPPNQVCYITQGKTMVASIAETTKLTVKRDSDIITLDCGNGTKTYVADLTVEGWTSIAFIDFGLVDYLTGAIWEYKEPLE